MDNLLEAIQNTNSWLNQINDQINGLKKALIGKKVTAKINEYFQKFNLRFQDHVKANESEADFDRLMQTAKNCLVYSNAIVSEINKSNLIDDVKVKAIAGTLSTMTSQAKKIIEDREIIFGEDNEASEILNAPDALLNERERLEKINVLISQIKNDISIVESRQQKREMKLENKLASLENVSESLESKVQQRLNKVDELYIESNDELNRKKDEINKLLETISGNIIAGDYEKSAANEMKMANWLRYGSLFCMFLITALVGYSFYESINPGFDWKTALFRLPFTLILSVPAAYLAKESSKHRQQQYNHLQTSLDLKAINPYLSTLPNDDQHRIKSEIANRLFAPKDFTNISSDSYPIDVQELIKLLLQSLDVNKASNSVSKVQEKARHNDSR